MPLHAWNIFVSVCVGIRYRWSFITELLINDGENLSVKMVSVNISSKEPFCLFRTVIFESRRLGCNSEALLKLSYSSSPGASLNPITFKISISGTK